MDFPAALPQPERATRYPTEALLIISIAAAALVARSTRPDSAVKKLDLGSP
jgi:hypothetical protein